MQFRALINHRTRKKGIENVRQVVQSLSEKERTKRFTSTMWSECDSLSDALWFMPCGNSGFESLDNFRIRSGDFLFFRKRFTRRGQLYISIVRFSWHITLIDGPSRLANGRKSKKRADLHREFFDRCKLLRYRIQCGCAFIVSRRKAAAVRNNECQLSADQLVMLAQIPHHHRAAPIHPNRPTAPGPVTTVADPVAHRDASGFSESIRGCC
jgi:hypothetical protein